MIIGLGHRKRVGKDSCADFLFDFLQNKGYTVEIKHFAYILKYMARKLYHQFGLQSPEFYELPIHEHLKAKKLEIINLSPREIWLQLAEVIRNIDPDFFVDYIISQNKEFLDFLIIPDLRFPNEFNKIKELGGLCIRIDRDIPESNDYADQALANETNWDRIIFGENLDDLYEKMWILSKWIGDKYGK